MEERVRMLSDYETENWSVSDLCRRYDVCRDTFYESRKPRESGVPNSFVDRSHAPLHRPHYTAERWRCNCFAAKTLSAFGTA